MKATDLIRMGLLSGGGGADPESVFFQYGVYHSQLFSDSHNYLPEVINQGEDTGISYTGGKANFNGSTSKISLVDNDSLTFINTADTSDVAFSFSTWINATNLLANKAIYKKGNEFQAVLVATTGKINFAFFNGGAGSVYLLAQTDVGLVAGVKTMVTVTYDGSGTFAGIKVYFGVTEIALTNLSSGSYVKMANTASVFTLGAGTGWGNFLGSMERATILKGYVFTTDDIAYLHNGGSGRDFSYDNSTLPYYFLHTKILATRGNYVLAYDYATNSKLWWSSDRGKTWERSYTWGSMFTGVNLLVHDKWIGFAHIFEDGTVIFATSKTMYRSTDGLANVTNPAIKGKGYDWSANDSDSFVFHTPVDSTRPGSYFMQGSNAQTSYEEISGQEILLWTNYCNVASYALGAAPTFVWSTNDNGSTIQAIYCFGQNLNARDNGSAAGGATGTPLGDSSNTLIVRHGHQAARRPNTNTWYIVTGDATSNIHWLSIDYNAISGLANSVTTLINSASSGGRYFGVGLNFIGEQVLRWSTDVALGGTATEQGVFENDPDDITTQTGESRVKDLGNKTIYGMIIQNGKAIVYGEGGELNTSIAIIADSGGGSVEYITIPDKVDSSQTLNHASVKDSKGFVKVNNDGLYSPGKKTIMIKV